MNRPGKQELARRDTVVTSTVVTEHVRSGMAVVNSAKQEVRAWTVLLHRDPALAILNLLVAWIVWRSV